MTAEKVGTARTHVGSVCPATAGRKLKTPRFWIPHSFASDLNDGWVIIQRPTTQPQKRFQIPPPIFLWRFVFADSDALSDDEPIAVKPKFHAGVAPKEELRHFNLTAQVVKVCSLNRRRLWCIGRQRVHIDDISVNENGNGDSQKHCLAFRRLSGESEVKGESRRHGRASVNDFVAIGHQNAELIRSCGSKTTQKQAVMSPFAVQGKPLPLSAIGRTKLSDSFRRFRCFPANCRFGLRGVNLRSCGQIQVRWQNQNSVASCNRQPARFRCDIKIACWRNWRPKPSQSENFRNFAFGEN